jgi:hypothetical protein
MAGVAVAVAAPQHQMQFTAQTLPPSLPQAVTYMTYPNAHTLPPQSSPLVQGGVGGPLLRWRFRTVGVAPDLNSHRLLIEQRKWKFIGQNDLCLSSLFFAGLVLVAQT